MPRPEPGTSGLEKTAPSGELEFSSRSNQKINSNSLMFFQFDLAKNSCSPEGALFSRPDIPGSGIERWLGKGNCCVSAIWMQFADFEVIIC